MDIKEMAAGLGIDLTSQKIRTEKRYLVIVEVVHGKRKRVGANKYPNLDPLEAKKEALSCFKFTIKHTDLISFRCLEIKYADVPIDTVLTGSTYEMQPIFSRWLAPEELKELLKTN